MSDVDTRPVEVARSDGETQPGLELVAERRVDGPADAGQPRTIVAVSPETDGEDDEDDERELGLLDTAQARVTDATAPDTIREVLGPKLELKLGGGEDE